MFYVRFHLPGELDGLLPPGFAWPMTLTWPSVFAVFVVFGLTVVLGVALVYVIAFLGAVVWMAIAGRLLPKDLLRGALSAYQRRYTLQVLTPLADWLLPEP